MTKTLTVGDLIAELQQQPIDAPVMIAVIKYPEEFKIRVQDDGEWRWTDSAEVECHLLEHDEVTIIDGIVHIAVELNDYDEIRHVAGG